MTQTQADIIYRMLEAATEGTWPLVRQTLVEEQGWTPAEIIDATTALTKLVGVTPMLEPSDF